MPRKIDIYRESTLNSEVYAKNLSMGSMYRGMRNIFLRPLSTHFTWTVKIADERHVRSGRECPHELEYAYTKIILVYGYVDSTCTSRGREIKSLAEGQLKIFTTDCFDELIPVGRGRHKGSKARNEDVKLQYIRFLL